MHDLQITQILIYLVFGALAGVAGELVIKWLENRLAKKNKAKNLIIGAILFRTIVNIFILLPFIGNSSRLIGVAVGLLIVKKISIVKMLKKQKSHSNSIKERR